MKSKNELTLINPQTALDRLPVEQLERIDLEEFDVVNIPRVSSKLGLQINSSGIFLGHEYTESVQQIVKYKAHRDEE